MKEIELKISSAALDEKVQRSIQKQLDRIRNLSITVDQVSLDQVNLDKAAETVKEELEQALQGIRMPELAVSDMAVGTNGARAVFDINTLIGGLMGFNGVGQQKTGQIDVRLTKITTAQAKTLRKNRNRSAGTVAFA